MPAATGNLDCANWYTTLFKTIKDSFAEEKVKAIRTNILPPRRCSLNTITPSLDAVPKGEHIIILAEDATAQFLDSLDSGLRCS